MIEIKKNLVDSSKYDIKCPYMLIPEFIVVHNTANDASAKNEIDYMIRNNNEVSFHIAIDDKEGVQGVPFERNTWHCGDGNGKGNRSGISIEICYSKSGGERFIQAEKNSAEYIARLLKEKGWGIDRVKKHQNFSNKYCPHRTLDMGWERFLDLIKSYMNESQTQIQPTEPKKENIEYRVHLKGGSWLSWINKVDDTSNGYAGIYGRSIDGIQVRNRIYQAHTLNEKWWSEVSKVDNSPNGYAGVIGRNIDGIKIKNAAYRVHVIQKGNLKAEWLPWVSKADNSNEGYAGYLGREIDGIQIKSL